jgi:hypothetical protein
MSQDGRLQVASWLHNRTIWCRTTKVTESVTDKRVRYLHAFSLTAWYLFGSVRTEWGHLANPQLAWHSYCQEPVAVRAVTLHSSHPNAVWSNTCLVLHNLYCEWGSGQQETSSRNLKG